LAESDYRTRLKETILRSGFPLEFEVDRALKRGGWSTFPSFSYVDPDEGGPREIDNLALFHRDDQRDAGFRPIGVSPTLLVECKRLDEYSTVIFRRGGKAVTYSDFEGQMYDFPKIIEKRPYPPQPWVNFEMGWFLTNARFHYDEFTDKIGNGRAMKPLPAGSEPDEDGSTRKGRAKDKVREGAMQLIKAQSYQVEQAILRDPSITNPYYPFYFTFMALVVEGKIVEVESVEGDINLHEVKHGVMRAGYKPSYSERTLNYLVDVVSKEYFGKYLEILSDDHRKLSEKILAEKTKVTDYLKRVERLPVPP